MILPVAALMGIESDKLNIVSKPVFVNLSI